MIKPNNLLTVKYRLTGSNLNFLINGLKKKGVLVYKTEKTARKTVIITILKSQEKIFFDYLKIVCYNNIKENNKSGNTFENLGVGGLLSPFYYLIKNVGVFIGLLLFFAVSVIFSFFTVKITYTGSGNVLESHIARHLKETGIFEYTFVDNAKLKEAEKRLNALEEFEFVSLKRRGNEIIVEAYINDKGKVGVDKTKLSLTSTVSGVVESVKVYRGYPAVLVGDTVEVGTTLINGSFESEDGIKLEGYVLGEVSIICNYRFSYYCEKETDEDLVLALAREALLGQEIVDYKIYKGTDVNGLYYTVDLKYRHIEIT